MARSAMNIQDSFLNQVRKDGTEIKMILMDGTTLIGVVRGFDSFTVILAEHGVQHLLYKHAIAQIISRRVGVRREDQGSRADGAAGEAKSREEPKRESFNTLNLSRVTTSEEIKT